MTIESRGVLYAMVACGGCGNTFVCNVYTVPNFKGVAACEPCITKLNDLRERMGFIRWTYPENTYPAKGPIS